MSRTILIYGQSGSGKTTSCRNLDPASTYYIDCDGKGLSWRGWRKQFNADNKNYMRCDSPELAARALNKVASADHICTIVVDGISTLMIKDEFRRMKEKTYDKWQELAACIYGLVDNANKLRDNLTIIFIGHVQIERDEYGNEIFSHVKTSGRKLEKIVLESLFTTVLYAKFDGNKYVFETKSRNSTAKSPVDALPDIIDNDIHAVIQALIKYEED